MLNPKIDKEDYRPFYIQVKQAIEKNIESGGWKIGEKMPGEKELEAMFNVSRTVIRQALNELVIEKRIIREKGRGTFVTKPEVNFRLVQELTGFYQDTIEQGNEPFTKVIKKELINPSAEILKFLGLEKKSRVIKMHRLRGIQKKPLILDTTYLPYELCPEVMDTDFSSRSLYAFLEEDLGFVIARAHRTLVAVSASKYVAEKLELEINEPIIVFKSIACLEDGRPIEYFEGYHSCRDTYFSVDLVRIKK